ncbi:MAG: alanine dehydrogenase [Thermodesulfovibrionales bacterium]|nr:alanine dehydrogenase [Thermodesulfovibrionales bacterium]
MVIGVPKEIKTHEYRVALTPANVKTLVSDGHGVLCEPALGEGSGFADAQYEEAGGRLAAKEELFGSAELIVKVKEPEPKEFGLFKKNQTVFTFLHLAPNRALTEMLLEKNIAGFAYETLEHNGGLPLLTPMSEIAGRMSTLMAAFYLQRPLGGVGVLPPGVAGVPPANITIIGAGTVGANAARVAFELGMHVTVLNRGVGKLHELEERYSGRINTLPATEDNIRMSLLEADAAVGAVLVPGGMAPVLADRKLVSEMKRGSVIVDVAIDQGGCFETSRPTTHDDPVYMEEGSLHYCVTNMPGAYPRTSTLALTNVIIPYVRKLASMGAEKAAREDKELGSALNTFGGEITHKGLADSINK